MKQNVASFLLMARRALCQAMLEQHIYFVGLSHCAFRNGSNLSSAWWLWKSVLPVFSESQFFFSPSKRNIMTSTCPPLPLQHMFREVRIFTENMFEAPLPIVPAQCSQSALLTHTSSSGGISEQGRFVAVSAPLPPRRLQAVEGWDYMASSH